MKSYFSLIKFSHTIFALPFALIGFFLAVWIQSYDFQWSLFLLVLLCMIFARSAAMAFNRYADRFIDSQNPRTAKREIPAGVITSHAALIFVVTSSVAFIATTYFINPLCFYLSPVALAVILGYSYTKRFTFLCHFILGIGLSLAPIGAYIAVTERFDILPIFFSLAVLFWVSGFDIIYALQDEEFDKEKKLFSVPAYLGKRNALMLSNVLHIISAAFIVFAGIYASFGIFYWIGTLVFSGLLLYQHTLVKPNDLSRVNMAFATTNGVASVIFAIFVLTQFWMEH